MGPDTQQADLRDPGRTAQFGDGIVDASLPRRPAAGIQFLSRRIAGTVVIESQRRVANTNRGICEMANGSICAKRFVT